MPAPLDKDKVRLNIIKAFQRCAAEKPLPQISLRDVARELGVSHGSILYYFKNKDELLLACSRWAGGQFCDMISGWFESHDLRDYPSESAYLDAFFAFTLEDKSTETMPRAVVMNCVMGDYSPELKADIRYEGDRIRETLRRSAEKSLARSLGEEEAQGLVILLFGVYFCAFNGVMTGYSASAFSCMQRLSNPEKT